MASGGLRQPLVEGARAGRKIWFAWLWTGLWIAAICALAGDHFSSNDTSRFVAPLLRWLLGGADAEWVATANYAVRKTAHLAEYAILAVLGLRALRLSFARPTPLLAPLTLALVLLVAAIDETRQAGTAKRSAAVGDVVLDLAGGVSGLVLAFAVQRIRNPTS
jgi:hypothetical protein